ncbi:hypothetical protein BC628DRAFT_722844 [Trametes gibbosa]|nr:hypothetical protein BC628DRAFT_722844 [Trametes gibbosa]
MIPNGQLPRQEEPRRSCSRSAAVRYSLSRRSFLPPELSKSCILVAKPDSFCAIPRSLKMARCRQRQLSVFRTNQAFFNANRVLRHPASVGGISWPDAWHNVQGAVSVVSSRCFQDMWASTFLPCYVTVPYSLFRDGQSGAPLAGSFCATEADTPTAMPHPAQRKHRCRGTQTHVAAFVQGKAAQKLIS